ncbi:MAG: DUF2975 domain-containing protein [Kordia sp.]|uniref:DUF2975 domain-containing protein n=1 Tax=Kordia sp. TaxID=1965332 RepID=UPI00385918D0
MKISSEFILKAMRVLAWIAFIGLLIKAGAVIMSYGVSIQNPEASKDLYKGMDLSRYFEYNFVHYSIITFYYIFLYLLQAYVALFATRLLSEINLEKPFTTTVASILQKISSIIFGVWILAIVHNIHVELLAKYATIKAEPFAVEFIFVAGIVYILAQLFKKGIVMQNENELTV